MTLPAKNIKKFYTKLYRTFGPQSCWPGNTRFEVIVGGILTQNTTWTNVERAIANLKIEKALTPKGVHALTVKKLARLIKPAGYFNVKARRLKNFTDHLFTKHSGSISGMFKSSTEELREELLSVNGIGPETCDTILLYAAERPVFVIDAYTKRMLTRHGLADEEVIYGEMQKLFMGSLKSDTVVFNEYHALIVRVGKDFCKKGKPLCTECPLGTFL